ncbi:MAG: regulatory iron-sulfur-containing complex subunit RicT [Bacteroidia bacterium]|nr:regulatory iron-sulfur-containing complex subunit RicT [Bacteroidia bacterium]
MGCVGCSTGSDATSKSLPGGCNNNGSCGVGDGCKKLNVFDWLANMELPGGQPAFDIVEVRFKNSRKDFFRNVNNLQLHVGDVIAVEASPGHDIGVVSISGELVRLQMKKKGVVTTSEEVKKVYRKAKPNDIEKWQEAQNLEQATMYRARTIAIKLKLQMKISDVEYQGDKTKAVFYYTADDRVDFRELIKVLADEFKVRIEMRQIGARQEAGRLGGIGSCGRELCCATWLTDFRAVSTSAARYQQLSLNPMKLAGQCGKLKCCLNYELDSYLDALKDFPEVNNVKLETEKGRAFHQKTDIFKRTMFFSYTSEPDNFIPLSVDRVKEVIEMNKTGLKPADLDVKVAMKVIEKKPDYENVVGQDSLTRFDKTKKQKQKSSSHKKRSAGPNTNKPNVNPSVNPNPNANPKPNIKPKVNPNANPNPNANVNPNANPNKPNPNRNRPNTNKPNNRPPRPNTNNKEPLPGA